MTTSTPSAPVGAWGAAGSGPDVRGGSGTRSPDRAVGPLPIVRREGLVWRGGAGGHPFVAELTLENPAAVVTRSTVATVRVAAFGAFLPAVPFARFDVAPIAPGASRRVVLDGVNGPFVLPAPTPRARFGATDVVQDAWLRAFRTSGLGGGRAVLPLLGGGFDGDAGLRPPVDTGSLVAMLTQLSARVAVQTQRVADALRSLAVQPHGSVFVGNLDVLLDDEPAVERHCAPVRCLRAGVTNVAIAFVHARAGDSVSFRSTVRADAPWAPALSVTEGAAPIDVEEGSWYPVAREAVVALRVTPPRGASSESEVVVDVTRRSDGRSVPVEFRLVVGGDEPASR